MATLMAPGAWRSAEGPVRLAVLHQAVEPPVIGGVRKAMKPGGYKDSSADIAYAIDHYTQTNPLISPKIEVLTPTPSPDPSDVEGWSFPDTSVGLNLAVNKHKATHLWANTVLFANHPLQTTELRGSLLDNVYIVGQPPGLVDKYDDKNWVNKMLKQDKRLRLPRSWVVSLEDAHQNKGLKTHLMSLTLPYPVIGKPIRGRGSHGVKLCRNLEELDVHLEVILGESPQVMIEEYLAGQEGTVTVMPPTDTRPRYWAFPVVERFNHADGVAPYNGVVAVLQNSRVVPMDVQDYRLMPEGDSSVDVDAAANTGNPYVDVRRQSETVAEKLRCTAPIRIDVRRRKAGEGTTSDNPFVMFDVNMKPNMTGPGRPSRDDQTSLTGMAAEALGWDYTTLLTAMLKTARPLKHLRATRLPDGP